MNQKEIANRIFVGVLISVVSTIIAGFVLKSLNIKTVKLFVMNNLTWKGAAMAIGIIVVSLFAWTFLSSKVQQMANKPSEVPTA